MKENMKISLDPDKIKQYEEIFLKFYPKVKTFTLKLMRNETDAEDISQDIFIKFLYQFQYLDDLDNIEAYLYTMTRNQIFNVMKHRHIEHSYAESVLKDYSDLPLIDLDQQLDDREKLLLANLSVENLPERRRKIFKMSRLEGLSNKEIAEKMDLSVRTVESQIYKALKEIRGFLLMFAIFIAI